MPTHKGVTASIEVNDKKLPEYNVSRSTSKAMSEAYLIAEEAQYYTICLSFSGTGNLYHHCTLIVDGELIKRVTGVDYSTRITMAKFRDPKKPGVIQEAKLRFAKIEGYWDEEPKSNPLNKFCCVSSSQSTLIRKLFRLGTASPAPRKLGVIKVIIRRQEDQPYDRAPVSYQNVPQELSHHKGNSKEGPGSYYTAYDLTRISEPETSYINRRHLIDTTQPWVTFEFKYGSRELLQSMLEDEPLVLSKQGTSSSKTTRNSTAKASSASSGIQNQSKP
ncbi:hypothetical protein TWF481_008730 [Arthrobotrys musiformis]|uniref:Uncharacterized protein n=1 Tax=Arthrobotrys musiformis TaxID=47236 RepID=A0AAV9W821_9PEZI